MVDDIFPDAAVQAQAPRKRGRPRMAQAKVPARQQARAPSRSGAVTVLGRDGEVLTRQRKDVGDPFEVVAPPGWSYQWVAISIVGNTELVADQVRQMEENGWRAVPATRYPGRFSENAKGSIIRGSQLLMERPMPLTIEARTENEAKARQLMSDRNAALKLSGVKDSLQGGFEMSRKYRGTGGDIRLSIDQALDVPRPQHQVADE